MNNKAIEKYVSHLLSCPQRYGDKLNPCTCGLDQALAELAEQPVGIELCIDKVKEYNKARAKPPVCETCGDTKEVWSCDEFGMREEPGYKIPCPGCQQPPAGEFTEWLRAISVCMKDKPEKMTNLEAIVVEQAAFQIDQQAEQIKQLEADKERLEDILRPFEDFSTLIDITRNNTTITLRDFMNAKQALKERK